MAAVDLTRNGRIGAPLWSVLSFWWLKDLFISGCRRPLELVDLPVPLPEDHSNVLSNRLQRNWQRELERKSKNPLIRAIFWTFRKEYSLLALITVFNDFVVRLVNPLLLQIVLRYFRGAAPGDTNGHESAFRDELYASLGIVLLSLAGVFSYNHITYMGCHNGGKLRTAVCGLIYRKTLRLSKATRTGSEVSPGHVTNLMSNDVSRFDMVSVFINWIWSAPLLTLAIAGILYQRIGWPPLVGIGIIAIVTPLQCHLGILSSTIQLKTAQETDERLRLIAELIAGIRMIKMYAWEKWFRRRILSVRERELRKIRYSALIRGIYMTMSMFVVRLMVFSTILALATVTLADNDGGLLTTENVFMISAYYTVIGHSLGQMFVRGVTEVAGVTVSINRIERYLQLEELQAGKDGARGAAEGNKTTKSPSIEIKNGTSYWSRQIRLVDSKTMLLYRNSPPALKDINFKCDKEHRLIAIVGPVGSGKTSMLELIMGELPIEGHGSVSVNEARISFSPQEPWLFNSSIKDNIVYGEPWDESRYDAVLDKCALREDLKQLPHYDTTIIVGERAAALSGGQKARISLARAVYRRADVYLLDDPLSAVDCQVGRYLFDDLIGPKGFLKDSVRLLVTHQFDYLKHVDWIVALNEGSIEDQGRPEDILTDDWDMGKYDMKPVARAESDLEREYKESPKMTLEPIVERSASAVATFYLKHGGKTFVIAIISALFVATQLVCSLADAFVAYLVQWEKANLERSRNATLSSNINARSEGAAVRESSLLLAGGSLLIAILLLGIIRTHVFQCNSLRTSARIHSKMLNGILQTPLRFFDTNPSGRILNKFSKDLLSMDVQLPKLMLDALQMLLIIVGALLVIVIVNPLFMVPLVLLILLFRSVRRIYLKTSKPLKRLDGITKSPVFTHVASTLTGLSVIRSSKAAQERMIRQFDEIQDLHTASWFTFQSATIAFCQVLDLFAVIFIATIIFYFLLFPSGTEGPKIGLVITQSMMMSGLLSWGMRQSAAVSNAFVSVERVLEYISLPKEEEEQEKAATAVDATWPNAGRIEINDMGFKYGNNQEVLHDINLRIESGQKIGIVGRTGAGKSSLIGALFRLSSVTGSISIDGVDTKTIPLEVLRQRLSIIPQDPILFHGTIRSNLDPNFEFPDHEILKALGDVEMAQLSLNFPVRGGGNNLSVGQKQLLCLARALLRKNRILILDEATANVDPFTDALIQRTIRTRFRGCTVLAIAHRINTILDSDMIVVVDQGRICDCGPPPTIVPRLPKLAIS